MLITRNVVHSAMEVAQTKMDELVTQPAASCNESLHQASDPDSSSVPGSGITE